MKKIREWLTRRRPAGDPPKGPFRWVEDRRTGHGFLYTVAETGQRVGRVDLEPHPAEDGWYGKIYDRPAALMGAVKARRVASGAVDADTAKRAVEREFLTFETIGGRT